jgi:hypothetical protein
MSTYVCNVDVNICDSYVEKGQLFSIANFLVGFSFATCVLFLYQDC